MLELSRRGFIALGLMAGLSACGEFAPATLTPAADATPESMLAAINAARKQYGAKPLAWSADLTRMARAQAGAMVAHDEMSHDFGPGLDLRSRATMADVHGPIGENVAAGQTSVEETLNAWLNSPGHRYTLLSDMWTGVGMAVQSGRSGSKYGIFWAADFGDA